MKMQSCASSSGNAANGTLSSFSILKWHLLETEASSREKKNYEWLWIMSAFFSSPDGLSIDIPRMKKWKGEANERHGSSGSKKKKERCAERRFVVTRSLIYAQFQWVIENWAKRQTQQIYVQTESIYTPCWN